MLHSESYLYVSLYPSHNKFDQAEHQNEALLVVSIYMYYPKLDLINSAQSGQGWECVEWQTQLNISNTVKQFHK